MNYAVDIRHLTKHFQKGNASLLARGQATAVACDDVCLQVAAGELVFIVGKNGSGKTTLLRLLSTLLLPDQGTALVQGYDLKTDPLSVRKSLGIATPDNGNFYLRLTGRENLKFYAHLFGVPQDEVPARIEGLTKLFDLGDLLDKDFQEYSSGMRQRFLLVRSLLADAPVILLDEPTKNLDPIIVSKFAKYVKEELVHKGKKTVFWTSHYFVDEILGIARMVVLDEGKIKVAGYLKDLQEKAGKNFSGLESLLNHFLKES